MARVWTVAQWVLIAVLLVLVARRFIPDLRLDDLGPLPDATYATLDGPPVSVSDFVGQVVVVNVWATWCPPCIVETPGFVDLQQEFDGDVVFLGVSQDTDMEAVRSFVDRYDIPYRMLVGRPLAGAPPAAAVLPTTYVLDRQGHVRMRHEGLLLEPALRSALRSLR
jgi:thiol-disulfide isomerase/thioredoxin